MKQIDDPVRGGVGEILTFHQTDKGCAQILRHLPVGIGCACDQIISSSAQIVERLPVLIGEDGIEIGLSAEKSNSSGSFEHLFLEQERTGSPVGVPDVPFAVVFESAAEDFAKFLLRFSKLWKSWARKKRSDALTMPCTDVWLNPKRPPYDGSEKNKKKAP